jgi:hypothetical protein
MFRACINDVLHKKVFTGKAGKTRQNPTKPGKVREDTAQRTLGELKDKKPGFRLR